MSFSLTIAGYTFENPPEQYSKTLELGNEPQRLFRRVSPQYYRSDSQNISVSLGSTLALNPAVGGTDDLDELERLQEIAIDGTEVEVEFDPFISGRGVIVNNPFGQSDQEANYNFTINMNSLDTDASAYPARQYPDTPNTFKLGELELGYDPQSVTETYTQATEQVDRLQGISQTVDNKGLIPRVQIQGRIDGAGQRELWERGRSNSLAYLQAEFQNGYALIDSLEIGNLTEAPHYLEGMFDYRVDLLIVSDPDSGIGNVQKRVDKGVKEDGTYVSDREIDGTITETDAGVRISSGSGAINNIYTEWKRTEISLGSDQYRYIWVEDPDTDGFGSIESNTSGFPNDAIELYEIETTSGDITTQIDRRISLMIQQGITADFVFTSQFDVDDNEIDFSSRYPFTDQIQIDDGGISVNPVDRSTTTQFDVDDSDVEFTLN